MALLTIVLTAYTFLRINLLAYWSDGVVGDFKQALISITIGEWGFPQGGEFDGWNLNIWEEEDTLNQNVPTGQLFSYGDFIYISLDSGYNPFYHGMPGEPNTQWAFVSTELNWRPNMNYRVNSVVVRDGRYFIANIDHNVNDWFINDPLTHNGRWAEWREIEPINEIHFETIQGTSLIDYASPNWDYIIYK